MSNRRWNRLPPFSYTPSPHRSWRHPEPPPDQHDGDADWADDDSLAASSTISRTPSTGPPRKKRKTRKPFFTRPKSSASTREPTWEPEEEDPDMLDSITVAGGFLIVGQGAIDLSCSSPPPPQPKKRGPGRPPATPKRPGSTAKKTRGKTKIGTPQKTTPSAPTRKGRSATNAAKQVSPELGHPELPHSPAESPTTERPGPPPANRGRRKRTAPPRIATPAPFNDPHAQEGPMPRLRNEIPSSVIDSDSDTHAPSNPSTPTSTEPAPPEPPPAPTPASVTWPAVLAPPPPNSRVNELAAQLTFNIYAFPTLNHPCYVLGWDLVPPRGERLSPLADIFPDAESPPRQEMKLCYERLRHVVGKEMGLLLPEAGADQEWGIFVNFYFPVQNQKQLDDCIAQLVHYGRPVHDIVLLKRGDPELYQAALADARRENRDFWKGRRVQMRDVNTGVILLQRGAGMTKPKAKPRNRGKKKGREKERKQPAGRKQTTEEHAETDMGPEIRDSVEPESEPAPAPSAETSSLAPEAGKILLRISPAPNASQESSLAEAYKSTTSAPAQIFSTKNQKVAVPPPPAPKDNEEERESFQGGTTDSTRTGKRKMGGYSSTVSNSSGISRNERSSAPKAETSSSKQKGKKGKSVDRSNSKENTPVAGPERKRRKIKIESPPSTLVPEASTVPGKPGKPKELEESGAPVTTGISGEPDMLMAIDLTGWEPEATAETHTREDPEVLAQKGPTEEKESSKPTEPSKEIEHPKEIQLPIDIEPQPVPEISQVVAVRAVSEVADSTAFTETSEIPEIQRPTAAANRSTTDPPPEPLVAVEASQAVVEAITSKTPVILRPPEETIPMELETPQEVAEKPSKLLEEGAEEQPEALDKVEAPEPEAGENEVTTTANLSQGIVEVVRIRARAQTGVTNEKAKEFRNLQNLNNNRPIEPEAKQKDAGTKEKGAEAMNTAVDAGLKHGDEENLKAKAVNSNEESAPKETAEDEAVTEELKNDKKGESPPKEPEDDVYIVPAKEPEVVSSAQGSAHKEPEETSGKEEPNEGVMQSTAQSDEQVDATVPNAAATTDYTKDPPSVTVIPSSAVVEESQVPTPTPLAVVVGTPPMVVVERIEDAPAKDLDDSGHSPAEADPPARAPTRPPPPPPLLETVHTPMDTSPPDSNNNIDVIMANNDAGEPGVQPMLPEQDLSAANTISGQDPTVPMSIDGESRSPVNDEQASKGKGKEIIDTHAVPNDEQHPTVPEPATDDADDEGSSPAQTYSQSVVDIQHGACLLLWAAEVPTEQLADTPDLDKNLPLPLTLPVPPVPSPSASPPPVSATLAFAPAAQTAEEPQVSQQPEEVHQAIAITSTPNVKRRSRVKSQASKDTAKPSKETAKPKAPKAKPPGQRASSKRSLIISLKIRNPESAQDEGTLPSRAEESHPDVAASTTRTPPPATPSNNWPSAPIGFTPVNLPSTPSPIRIPSSTPAALPRPQPYRRPGPAPTPRQILAKQGAVSPNPRSTSSAELLAAARKQAGQTKNAKPKVASPRVGSATSSPDYPSAPIPPPIAPPQSLGRVATNATNGRRNQLPESTPSPNTSVRQQQQLTVAPPPVDEPIQQIPVVATASPSQHVVPRPVYDRPVAKEGADIARNVSPLAIDKSKEMQVHPVPEDSPAAKPAHPAQAVSVQPSKVLEPPIPLVQSNDPSPSNNTPIITNPLPAARIDPQTHPAAREQTPAAKTTSPISPDTPPTTAEKAVAPRKSPGNSIDVTTTRQSTPFSLPPARSTPEYIDSKKLQPLVPRENFLYWEPSIGKVGGAGIEQPIGTLLGEAGSTSASVIHASASGLGSGFPTSLSSSGRPLFLSSPPAPLRPLSVSPPPPPQPKPQAPPPLHSELKPQIQPQDQSQVQPQPQPQVELQTQLQAPSLQAPLQTQPDAQPAPPPQPGTPALSVITTKEMIFHISHYEGNDQKITLHGRDFLSPEGFNWNRFAGVLTKMMSFNDLSEILVVNLHHLVDDSASLNEGIPFYRKVNEVLIAKVDPVGRPPKELGERIKSERKSLREWFKE